MNIGLSNTAALFGAPQNTSNASVYDLVTGTASSSYGLLQSSYLGQSEPTLTSTQTASIKGLNEFVNENVKDGPQKESLLKGIEALENLLSSGNAQSPGIIDPAFALLAGNPLVLGQSTVGQSGLIVDQLL